MSPSRTLLYFHHIYSSKKIRHLQSLAQSYQLTGIMKTSRPGFLFAETLLPRREDGGSNNSENVDRKDVLEAFVKDVKGMRWQEVRVVHFSAVEPAVAEKGDGGLGRKKEGEKACGSVGFLQVEKMREFSEWMHERELGEILKESVLR
jgi:hypothetical protein